jgi:type IV secretion system protein TrbI
MSVNDTPEPGTEALPPPLTGGHALYTRVAPTPAQQINKKSVRAVFLVSAGVLSLAFVYAFVVSPAVKAEARARQAEENQRTPPGSVRPADVLSDGPVSYADLTKGPEELPQEALPLETPTPAPRSSAGPAHPPRVVVQRTPREPRMVQQAPAAPRGPSEAERARTSGLFFVGATPPRHLRRLPLLLQPRQLVRPASPGARIMIRCMAIARCWHRCHPMN